MRTKCSQCNIVVINGIPCHEMKCPNENERWVVDVIQGDDYLVPENEASEPYLETIYSNEQAAPF